MVSMIILHFDVYSYFYLMHNFISQTVNRAL